MRALIPTSTQLFNDCTSQFDPRKCFQIFYQRCPLRNHLDDAIRGSGSNSFDQIAWKQMLKCNVEQYMATVKFNVNSARKRRAYERQRSKPQKFTEILEHGKDSQANRSSRIKFACNKITHLICIQVAVNGKDKALGKFNVWCRNLFHFTASKCKSHCISNRWALLQSTVWTDWSTKRRTSVSSSSAKKIQPPNHEFCEVTFQYASFTVELDAILLEKVIQFFNISKGSKPVHRHSGVV